MGRKRLPRARPLAPGAGEAWAGRARVYTSAVAHLVARTTSSRVPSGTPGFYGRAARQLLAGTRRWHAPLVSRVNKGESLPSTVIRVQVGGEPPRASHSCLCRAECPAAWHSCAWRGSSSAPRAPGPAPRRVPRGPAAVRAALPRPWVPTAPARGPQRELGLGGQRRWGREPGCAPGPPWPWRRRWT